MKKLLYESNTDGKYNHKWLICWIKCFMQLKRRVDLKLKYDSCFQKLRFCETYSVRYLD